ncbi:group III truncated hemoglobin [uncultured Sulfitobacter sp.]|uniref:group III truncated hemoglobin n=1 Tax=Sulfitobacter sp. SH22 TaxID=3421172 RepID=UPI001B50976D|nr:group III truncated hemoglobin [uncultured Sulfitobacter sp.]MBQ0806132.1 group III truncated hemoglobin [Sulfitobacter sp.]
MTIPPRIPVTVDQIQTVVAQFYARVRAHPVLGPVFAAHVTDWPPHETKITLFWRNALLLERCYNGNPMQVHAAAGNVKSDHFAIWLALFDAVLEQELPQPLAQAWSTLAHRIGRGLSYGLPSSCGKQSVPDLGAF